MKLLLVVAALAVAGHRHCRAIGGKVGSAIGSPAKAVDYVTRHRLDLGSPGIAVGVVSPNRSCLEFALR
jgi:hypothetical protein